GGLQVGGGINSDNCLSYIEEGASHVIVTSRSELEEPENKSELGELKALSNQFHIDRDTFINNIHIVLFYSFSILAGSNLLISIDSQYVFNNGQMDLERLKDLVRIVGKERLVLDLSCRRKVQMVLFIFVALMVSSAQEGKYAIVTDRWQKFSDVSLDAEVMQFLANFADEFLVHGVDVEGKKLGIDEELVALLGKHSPIPVTYAGGVTVMNDLERIKTAGMDNVDVTVGSALDIFGGNLAYKDVVAWHNQQKVFVA
ncbi:hypothetical protein L195_g020961, partial [Trifolium pratense]